jgi:hypothetical protein
MSSDWFGSNLIGSDRISSDRFGSDRIGPVRFGPDRLGPVRFGSVLTNVLHTPCSSNVDIGIHSYRTTGTLLAEKDPSSSRDISPTDHRSCLVL